jgi:RIO kinase 1
VHPDTLSDAVDALTADGFIDEVLYPIKSGKEGTLYCCRAGPRIDAELAALKLYKEARFRAFRDDSLYRAGRVILDRRSARAAAKRSRYGQEVRSKLWTNAEFETLQLLHRAGADVPKPLALSGGAVVMEWIGDNEAPAPQLKDVHLSDDEAGVLWDRLMESVELWLACNIVHGDLSAYNLLYHEGRLVAIDFPQASDARTNANANLLLTRDLTNVAHFFSRFGVASDPYAIVDDLWDRFLRGRL